MSTADAATVPLRVVVADDHPLFLDGIAALVSGHARFELLGQACTGDALAEVVAAVQPDVVVTDLRMPGLSVTEAIHRMLASQPKIRILVLSMHDDSLSVGAALRAGASGYTLKEAAPEVVIEAIEAVGRGLTVLGPGIPLAAAASTGDTAGELAFPELTNREREIAALVATGHTNLAIARRLGVSEKTVRNTLSVILTKIRVVDRAALVDKARAAGLAVR